MNRRGFLAVLLAAPLVALMPERQRQTVVAVPRKKFPNDPRVLVCDDFTLKASAYRPDKVWFINANDPLAKIHRHVVTTETNLKGQSHGG